MFSGFRDYLINKAVVKEKYVPYYIKWVAGCYAFLDEPGVEAHVSPEDKERYLGHLSKTNEDWQ
jgi:hypothetical protein